MVVVVVKERGRRSRGTRLKGVVGLKYGGGEKRVDECFFAG